MSQRQSPASTSRVSTERRAPTDGAATGVVVHADGLDPTVAMVRENVKYLKGGLQSRVIVKSCYSNKVCL